MKTYFPGIVALKKNIPSRFVGLLIKVFPNGSIITKSIESLSSEDIKYAPI